ncbi:MAG: hypothetical protein AAGF74_14465 [Pseudomonadota bacterium]
MQPVSAIELRETVSIDQDRLADLYARLGPVEAEGVVCRILEDLAVLICRVEADLREGAFDSVCLNAGTLVPIAGDIGLATLSRVAADAAQAARRRDLAATAATVARLSRIGDRSLVAIWDLQDRSV